MVKKIVIISISSLVAIALSLLIYFFRVPITSFFTGSKYITAEDGQALYDKGLAEGKKNEQELKDKVDYYLSLMNNFPKLEKELASKNTEIENLNNVIDNKTNEINQLNVELNNCRNEILLLENNAVLNSEKIAQLQSEAIALRSVITQKEQELLNVKTQKTELLATIKYYENFISQLESDTQAVASFEYNGSIISIQILNKGSFASIVPPSDTEYVKFNYWTVDGVEVDLSTYPVNSSTKFVANLTKYCDVKFIVDDVVVSNNIVKVGDSFDIPNNPVKENFNFLGWSINGVDVVDLANFELTSSVEFVALFREYSWNVNFVNNDSVISTQVVSNNEFAIPVYVSDTKFAKFKGWSLDNENIVDVSTYAIVSDCVFYAIFDYYYEVNFYDKNDELISSQLVLSGEFAESIILDNSDDPYKVFIGWQMTNGNYFDLSNPITQHLDLYAVFETSSGMYYESEDGSIAYMSWSELQTNGYIKLTSDFYNDDYIGFRTLAPFDSLVGKFVIDDSITTMSSYSFEYVSGVTELVLPNSILLIGDAGFLGDNFDNLKSLVIPDNFPGCDPVNYNTLHISCLSLEKIWIPSNASFKLLKAISGVKHMKIFTDAPNRKSNWNEDFNETYIDRKPFYFDVVYGATIEDYYNYSYKGYELLDSEIEVSFNANTWIDLSPYVTVDDIENDLDFIEINIKSLNTSHSGSYKPNGSTYVEYIVDCSISNLTVGGSDVFIDVNFSSSYETFVIEDGVKFYLIIEGGKIYLMCKRIDLGQGEDIFSKILRTTFVIDSILFYD